MITITTGYHLTTRLGLLLVFLTGNLLVHTLCLSSSSASNKHNNNNHFSKQEQVKQLLGSSQQDCTSADDDTSSSSSCSLQRRTFLSNIPKTLTSLAFLSASSSVSYPKVANAVNGRPTQLTTVILDAPDDKIGVELVDVILGRNSVNNEGILIAVKSLNPNGKAASSGVKEGMVFLTKQSSMQSADVIAKIKKGPYPMAFQFYSLAAEEEGTDQDGNVIVKETPAEALERVTSAAMARAKSKSRDDEGPPVSARGAGLGVKTVVPPPDKSSCIPVKRGDGVTIRYEARVASPGGPIYDSTGMRNDEPSTFVLGDGKAINGVDIGMGGMCKGEVRELDIPAGLGYGRYGSEIFDIPGDVRLWWRLELLDVTPKAGMIKR